MITGDNKETAEAIGRELGIISEPQDANHVVSFTGAAFEKLPPADQRDVFENLESNGLIFSRTEPRHKQTIVRVMRQLGHVVAMTGDGVNDAPALKQADIGIAMGIAGTEVAKEASDMVLADDNFSTIVAAIEEGRSIYNNMKAFIRYLISSNIGEVASIFLTAALGIPEAMVPVQLLWVNLVTDGLPATALGFNPPDLDVMSKAPRGKNESLISSWVFFRYLVIGAYVGLSTVGIFVYWFVFDTDNGHSTISFNQLTTFGECATWSNFDPFVMDTYSNSMVPLSHPCAFFDLGKQKASTLSLTVLVMVEMFNALNALSEDGSLWHVPPSRNPYLILAILLSVVVHFAVLYLSFLRRIFNVVALDAWDWQLVLLFSVPVIFLDELLKACGRQLHASQSHRLKQD
jgi:Ca2+-transporting ATPase